MSLELAIHAGAEKRLGAEQRIGSDEEWDRAEADLREPDAVQRDPAQVDVPASLRTEIERVRQAGYAGRNTGLLEGMAGVAVPILDREGRAVAALSAAVSVSRFG